MLSKNIGWLHTLGNDIDEPYFENKTGGPSIKVNIKKHKNTRKKRVLISEI